jgi:hypothetical protein
METVESDRERGDFAFPGVGRLHRFLAHPAIIQKPFRRMSESRQSDSHVNIRERTPHYPLLSITLDSVAVVIPPMFEASERDWRLFPHSAASARRCEYDYGNYFNSGH